MQSATNPTSLETTAADLDPLLARLRNQAQQAGGGGVAFIAGGVALTLLFMSWPAGIVHFLTGGWVNFWVCYAIALACIVPFILKRLKQDRTVYAETSLTDEGRIDRPSSYGEMELNFAKFDWEMVKGWIMLGPRLIVDGIEQTQGIQSSARQHLLVRCARMLRDLAAIGQATTAKSLMHGNETPKDIDHLINYLDRNDWVGASSDHKRVWLSSKAIAELPGLGVAIRRE